MGLVKKESECGIFYYYNESTIPYVLDGKVKTLNEEFETYPLWLTPECQSTSLKISSGGLFDMFLKSISYYRNKYGHKKGEELFVKENELYCWIHKNTLYFKTEEARTKFIMKWS